MDHNKERLSETDESLSDEEQKLLNQDKHHKPLQTLLLSGAFFFGGYWFYSEINAVEEAGGGTVSLPKLLGFAYDIAGKWGVTGACLLAGVAFLVGGIFELTKGPPSQRPRK